MYRLLAREKNAFHRILDSERLDPRVFKWTVRHGPAFGWSGGAVNSLDHVDGEFFFAFDPVPPLGWNVRYSPGEDGRYGSARAGSWDSLEHYVTMWAIALRGELAEPDLWAEFAESAATLPIPSSELTNTPFAREELERVHAGLDGLAAEIDRNQRLTKIQTRMLLDAVEESRGAASRVGRKDWVLILYAQLLGTVTAAAIQPEVAKALALAAQAAFSWLTGHPALPPNP